MWFTYQVHVNYLSRGELLGNVLVCIQFLENKYWILGNIKNYEIVLYNNYIRYIYCNVLKPMNSPLE